MLRQKELSYVDKILRQISTIDKPFGGYAVLLVGDPAQIPAVQGRVVWDESNGGSEDDLHGHLLYTSMFQSVIELTEVRRLDNTDDDAVKFLDLLDRLRDGECTDADWILVKETCSQDTIPAAQWNERFNDDTNDVTYLFNTNNEVFKYNIERLKKLKKPIALIEAEHTGNSKKMKANRFMGLESSLYVSVDSKVVMTNNVCQPAGLCNGAVGIVKDIIYEVGKTAPSLPLFVWVDFGETYKGLSLFSDDDPDRKGWVPVHPYVAKEWSASSNSATGYSEDTRTMLPLKLAWAWTTWKAQGQTISGKLVALLGPTEKEHGLTYTAFSRVTRFSNLGITGGLTFERFTSKIKNHAKVAPRRREETRLRNLSTDTIARLQNAQ